MALKITLHNSSAVQAMPGTTVIGRRLNQLELIQRQLDILAGDYRCNAVRPYDFYVRFMNILMTLSPSMCVNIHCKQFAIINTQLDTQFNMCEFLNDLYKNSPGQLTLQARFR